MRRYRAIAEYYDPEYEYQEMLQRDVPFMLEQMPRRPVDVLELAAGTARAAIPLAQAGHRVVAVDYAPDMLEIARRKRDAVGLTDRQLRLVEGDVLDLRLGRRFDWVCILFNTFLNFTTLAEQDRFMQSARRHLKPGGRLWIDVFLPNLQLLARRHSANLEPAVFYVPQHDRTVCRTTEIRPDPANQRQEVTFHYMWFDADGRQHRRKVQFELTFVFPREMEMLLERNGLRLLKMWGDYGGEPVRSDSPRMICMGSC